MENKNTLLGKTSLLARRGISNQKVTRQLYQVMRQLYATVNNIELEEAESELASLVMVAGDDFCKNLLPIMTKEVSPVKVDEVKLSKIGIAPEAIEEMGNYAVEDYEKRINKLISFSLEVTPKAELSIILDVSKELYKRGTKTRFGDNVDSNQLDLELKAAL